MNHKKNENFKVKCEVLNEAIGCMNLSSNKSNILPDKNDSFCDQDEISYYTLNTNNQKECNVPVNNKINRIKKLVNKLSLISSKELRMKNFDRKFIQVGFYFLFNRKQYSFNFKYSSK